MTNTFDTVLTIWNWFFPIAVIHLIAALYCRIKYGFLWLQNLKTNYRKGGIFSKSMIVTYFLSLVIILSLTVYLLIVTR